MHTLQQHSEMDKMANETKLMLPTQQEKPNHYTYLKEFRVEQCQSFLQHKCNQHRPFICFNWHFQNQRRRRPIRKRDGTFNYSADNYCTKYDETTGICPDADECPFLHRTAGDTERRYHLRYYKTCMCVHDTDSRGYCVKNGHHCAFAHGQQDQRPPVYDIKELETLTNAEIALDGTNAQNALDKERNLMNEDPKWQDTNYVLANYKTEPCKRPPRLCRQGYACPQYHNSKDKRRSPRKFKYRSTPCPNVKHGEEWGEPGNCEAGDNCQYCHTRTEQQFHPEIYKSTKCNDVQQAGYCPRSVFCAFAHVEPFIFTEDKTRDIDGNTTNLILSDLISSALPEIKPKDVSSKSGLISITDNNGNPLTLAAIIKRTLLPKPNPKPKLDTSSNLKIASIETTTSNSKLGTAKNLKITSIEITTKSAEFTTTTTTTKATVITSKKNTLSNKAPGSHLVNKNSNSASSKARRQITEQLQRVKQIQSFNNDNNNDNANYDISSNTFVNTLTGEIKSNLLQKTNGFTRRAISGAATKSTVTTANTVTSDFLKFLNNDGNDTNNILVNALEKSANQGKFINFSLPLDRISACSIDDPRENSLSASLANTSLLTRSSAPINIPNSTLNNSLNDFNSGGFAVNIPSSSLTYSPTNHTSSFFGVSDFNYSGSNSNKLSNSLTAATQNDSNNLFFPSRIISPGFADGLSISPSVRISELNSIRDDINSSSVGNSLFENSLTSNKNAFSLQSLQNQNNSDFSRLTNEIMTKNSQILKLSNRIDETSRKLIAAEIHRDKAKQDAYEAELQRDKAKQEAFEWKERFDLVQTQLNLSAELRNLSIQKLKQLQSKLRTDLEDVEKVLYLENAKKCMTCEKNNRTVTLEPCNHFILCNTCACSVTECPYCQVRVERTHT